MNTRPIVDLKISSSSLQVPRAQASSRAQDGADFSKTFQDSLNAISRGDEPSVVSDKPVQKSPVKASDRQEREISEDVQQGQDVPAALVALPANLAGTVPLVALGSEAIETALQPVGSVDGASSAKLAMDNAALAQALAATPNAGNKGLVTQAELKQPIMAMKANQTPTIPINAGSALPAGAVGLNAASLPLEVLGLQTKVAADDGSIANQALLQSQQIAQSISVPVPKQASEISQADLMMKAAEATGGVASNVDLGDKPEPAALPTQSPGQPTFADKALASTVIAPEVNPAGGAAENSGETPLLLDVRLSLPVVEDDAVDNAPVAMRPDDVVPLGGLGPALSGNQIGGVGSAPAFAAPPVAPAVMVPAAHLNHELVKFAGAGGGHAVMEIISPELGALKIELSIDGKGVARMVVEASTSAARDQLEQGMRQLHDDFAGLGLSLNVDLRQGGGSAYQRDASSDAWSSAPRSMGSIAADPGSSVAGSVGVDRVVDEKSRVHFYA